MNKSKQNINIYDILAYAVPILIIITIIVAAFFEYSFKNRTYDGDYDLQISKNAASVAGLDLNKKHCPTGTHVLNYSSYRSCCSELGFYQKFYDNDKKYIVYVTPIHTEVNKAQAELVDVKYNNHSITADIYVWDNGDHSTHISYQDEYLPYYMVVVPVEKTIGKATVHVDE